MKISIYDISKNQISIIKGLAISMIVFHNFLHLTNGIGENEMAFFPDRIYILFDTILNAPSMFFNGLFSYGGHYGVQLFIFASGFGLAKKFGKKDKIEYKYILPQIIKLYGLILFGLLTYFILFFNNISYKWFLMFSMSSLLMYKNFFNYSIFSYVGPWWYFGLALQLYLIFPFLYRFIHKYREKGAIGLIAASYLLIYLLKPLTNEFDIAMFGNFLGHLPEFVLGISLAMFKQIRLSWKIIIPSLVLFILSNFFRIFFPFSFLSVTILLLATFYPIYSSKKGLITTPLLFIGNISMFIFVINGPLRQYSFKYTLGNSPIEILISSCLHFIFVLIISYLMMIVYNKLVILANRIYPKKAG